MADTVLTELKIHDFDTLEQMSQYESEIGDNDLVLTPDTTAKLFLFKHAWADYLVSDMSWLRADTFSWHSGETYKAAYEHLADDVNAGINRVEWHTDGTINTCYTRNINPQVGDSVYSDTSLTTEIGVVEATGSGITVSNNKVYHFYAAHSSGTQLSETIAGVQIRYYLADDGHIICLSTQESNISALYEATGVAWYYILDAENKQFKLPRTKYGFTGLRDSVGDYVPESLPNITAILGDGINTMYGTVASGAARASYSNKDALNYAGDDNTWSTQFTIDASRSSSAYQNGAPVQERATQMYLYFYVGNFGQTAVEQTAGITSETLNNKADTDLSNIPSNYDYVIESQEPTADNNYTWYRLHKSGWIEQGGRCPDVSGTGQINLTGTYPVPMKTRWQNATPIYVSGASVVVVAIFATDTAVSIVIEKNTINNSLSSTSSAWWSAVGYVIE